MEVALVTVLVMMGGVALIAMFIGGFFMWMGAKMAGVPNATLGKSMLAAVGASLVTWVLSMICSIVIGPGTLLGFLVGLFFSLLVIKSVYGTGLVRALLVWVFHIFAEILAILIGLLIFGGTLYHLMGG